VIRISGPAAAEVLQRCTGRMTPPRLATLARVLDAHGRVVEATDYIERNESAMGQLDGAHGR
jgi:tRNA U34 5-carboxymethylaminomethyl modifying GTPase MnmE/TrmE